MGGGVHGDGAVIAEWPPEPKVLDGVGDCFLVHRLCRALIGRPLTS